MSNASSFADLTLVKKKSDELNETISNASSKASLHSHASSRGSRMSKSSRKHLGKTASWASVRSHLSQKDFKNQMEDANIEGGHTHGYCEKGIGHEKSHISQKSDMPEAEKSINKDDSTVQARSTKDEAVKNNSNKVAPANNSQAHFKQSASNHKSNYRPTTHLEWYNDPKNRPKILAGILILIFGGLIMSDIEEEEPITADVITSCYDNIPKQLWDNELLKITTCVSDTSPQSLNAITSPASVTINIVPGDFSLLKGKQPTISGRGIPGGSMASLVHTIYSATFDGVAIINGRSYAMQYFENKEIDHVHRSVDMVLKNSKNGKIDDINNFIDDKVYILHGNDGTVYFRTGFGHTSEEYYNIINCLELTCKYNNTEPIVPMETPVMEMRSDTGRNFGSDFPVSKGEPVAIINFLYDLDLQISSCPANQTIYSFSITAFCPANNCAAVKMEETAYYTAPYNCRTGIKRCPVHIYLHDAMKSFVDVGADEIESTKFGCIGDLHDIIVVFPQTTDEAASCWNYGHGWYDDYGTMNVNELPTDHLTYKNKQALTFKRIINSLTADIIDI